MKSVLLTLLASAALPASAQALRLVASEAIPDQEVLTTSSTTETVSFAGITEPITGIGITGLFTGIRVDNEDGFGPWSLDARITATSPDNATTTWNPIGGDVSFADYPFADATDAATSNAPNGEWTFVFDSVVPDFRWTYGLENPVLHLLADAPELTDISSVSPDASQQWNRPFFISAVSGLGPVAYSAREFTVSESGLYTLESVLTTVSDHYTFLYQGEFNPDQPLSGLLDYGLGNGSSPFGVPRGTSRISALLFEGETYHWVTSQWSRTTPIFEATNTATGPGELLAPSAVCLPDVNQDGELNGLDFGAWLSAFNAADPRADQNQDGAINGIDFGAWLSNFNDGCTG